jgi:homoserine dehydrogenase
MSAIEVLKFGSSVLRSPDDLPIAVDEIYRHWRLGSRLLVVVSAFEGVTDRLLKEATTLFGDDATSATASFVATGEQRTATLLVGSLIRSGIPARLVEPHEIGLLAEGTSLESTPVRVDAIALERFWVGSPILILPGFYGIDIRGRTALFGRGGSDLSALFLASELGASCRLFKDVDGVFDADPVSNKRAHRFTALSWATAIDVAGPLIQPKALRYAQGRTLPFRVGRPNESTATLVGQAQDESAPPLSTASPLRVVLLGCGVVGRGVYDILQLYPQTFDVRHVVVGDPAKHSEIARASSDRTVVLDPSIDIVVECFGGVSLPYPLIVASLAAGKIIVTANKALVAAHWAEFCLYARDPDRQLWFSAAVGGALPVLETLENLAKQKSRIREIRGSINGTCGVVLDARAEGKTCAEAIALAKAGGFAEADPTRDLSGRDSADKLALMIYAAFGEWFAPETLPTSGIDAIAGNSTGYKLIARARREGELVTASVAPEFVGLDSFLGQARGADNCIEIELESGDVIKLSGQGAGRWPTAVSVVADLHEVARRAAAAKPPLPRKEGCLSHWTVLGRAACSCTAGFPSVMRGFIPT